VSKKRIVLDTNVLGWALRDKINPSDRAKKLKAEKYLAQLNREDTTIILPTIVLFELLSVYSDSPQDKTDKINFLDVLSEWCQVTDFDDLAADTAANMFNATNTGTSGYDPAEREKSKRKTDTMILAQASCAEADELITNDLGFRKLADALTKLNICSVMVKDIPEDAQMELDELIDQ